MAELRHRRFATDSDASTPPSPSTDSAKLHDAPTGFLSRSSSTRSLRGGTQSRGLSTPSWSPVKLPLFTRNAADDFLSGGLPLFDLLVSLEAHLDLLQRRWRPVADEWKAEWKVKAKEAGAVGSKTRDGLKEGIKHVRAAVRGTPAEREFKDFVASTKVRVKRMQEQWNDSKVVSMRDKFSFFASVNNVLGTTVMLAFWPEYIPIAYTIQAVYFLPWRVYSYKKLSYHYFCFDLCYFVNVMVLLYLWVFPSSTLLFLSCYGLTLGPLATAIATWRNSLVFHSLEKVTSLYIHLYPPLVMIVLVHFYPDAPQRYTALQHITTLPKTQTIAASSITYLVWQFMYWRLVLVARKEKIEKGERTTSFTYMLAAKRGIISKLLKSIPEKNRAGSFIAAQFVYTVVTMLPAVYCMYGSKYWSSVFLWAMFGVSVWNGASFYMEVFGRRFERELHSLRKELDDLQRDLASSRTQSPATTLGLGCSLGTNSLGLTPAPSLPISGDVTPSQEGDGSRRNTIDRGTRHRKLDLPLEQDGDNLDERTRVVEAVKTSLEAQGIKETSSSNSSSDDQSSNEVEPTLVHSPKELNHEEREKLKHVEKGSVISEESNSASASDGETGSSSWINLAAKR